MGNPEKTVRKEKDVRKTERHASGTHVEQVDLESFQRSERDSAGNNASHNRRDKEKQRKSDGKRKTSEKA